MTKNTASGSVFTKLYFLYNTRMRPLRQSFTLHQGRKSLVGKKTLQLIGPIGKLQSKFSVVNTAWVCIHKTVSNYFDHFYCMGALPQQ
jgi:hypothetical protein